MSARYSWRFREFSGTFVIASQVAVSPSISGIGLFHDLECLDCLIHFYHDASTLNDGTVLISGGSDVNTRAKATAEIYDPTTAAFTATGSMNAARVWYTSTVLQNGKVLLTGGGDNGAVPIATAEIYQ